MELCNPKISVIIPVYNGEKFFEKCLNSLKNQTFKDFEVIIVNNGSTDNSENIAKQFAENDSRFKLILHSDGKAGECRSIGIDIALGEYISFVDCDDSVDERFLETLYNEAIKNNADIVNCDFKFYFLSTQKFVKSGSTVENACYDNVTALKYLLKDKKIRFYLWNKLWRKSLFTEHNIRIPNMYYEDAAVCPQLFYYAKKVVSTDYCGYFYMRVNSKYKEVRMTPQRINDYINTIPIIRLFFEEHNCYKTFKSAFKTHICHVFFSIPTLVFQAKKESKNNSFKNIVRGMSKVIKCCTISSSKLKNINLTKAAVE